MDFKKNLKIGLSAVGTMYIVSAILRNALTCLYANPTSDFFHLDPPALVVAAAAKYIHEITMFFYLVVLFLSSWDPILLSSSLVESHSSLANTQMCHYCLISSSSYPLPLPEFFPAVPSLSSLCFGHFLCLVLSSSSFPLTHIPEPPLMHPTIWREINVTSSHS